MACGAPVIVRRAGGSTEAIEDLSSGLIYESPEELLPLIDRVVADSALRKSLSEQVCKESLSRYSEKRWVERYFEIIQACTAKKLN